MYATNPTLNATGMRRPTARAPEFMAELDDIDDVVDVVDNGLDSVVPEGPEGEVEFESGEPSVAEAKALAVGAWNCSMSYFALGLMGKTLPCWRCVWREYHLAGDVSLTVIVR